MICGAEYDEANHNPALIAVEGKVIVQPKLVRSPYDLPEIVLGETISIFEQTALGRFAVLVCADQISHDLLDALRGSVDLVVVVARNRAVAMFESTAAGDAYRLYAYLLVVNDQAAGASFLAAPRKPPGDIMRLPKACGASVGVELELGKLRSHSRPINKHTDYG